MKIWRKKNKVAIRIYPNLSINSLHTVKLCMLFFPLLIFFKINFLKNQEYNQSVKQFGSWSGEFSVVSVILFILATPTGQSLGLSKCPRKFSHHLDFSDKHATFCLYVS